MGFLDTIRDRLRGGDEEYYEDDYYEDDDFEGDSGYARDSHESRRRDPGSSPRLLGNTPRPEAESVSVFTRSGRPVAAPRQEYAPQTQSAPRPFLRPLARPRHHRRSWGPPAAPPPGDLGPRTISRVNSGQLPPYVLKPVSYDDVQTVVRRVRTGQPRGPRLRNTNIDTAKRILDFCFGLSCGISGSVEELGDRVFAVLPSGVTLSPADVDKLVADGDLTR